MPGFLDWTVALERLQEPAWCRKKISLDILDFGDSLKRTGRLERSGLEYRAAKMDFLIAVSDLWQYATHKKQAGPANLHWRPDPDTERSSQSQPRA